MELTDLEMGADTTLAILEDDNITGDIDLVGNALLSVERAIDFGTLTMANASSLIYTQMDAQADGLSLSQLDLQDDVVLAIEFDGIALAGLDFGLQVDGDQRTLLQDYLDTGRITFSGGSSQIGIIYDQDSFGDSTYLGVVNAVPEPSSLFVIAMGLVGMSLSRRRKMLAE